MAEKSDWLRSGFEGFEGVEGVDEEFATLEEFAGSEGFTSIAIVANPSNPLLESLIAHP